MRSGAQFVVEHLDRRRLVVASEPGAVYRAGDTRVIKEEGMPHKGTPYQVC